MDFFQKNCSLAVVVWTRSAQRWKERWEEHARRHERFQRNSCERHIPGHDVSVGWLVGEVWVRCGGYMGVRCDV